MSNESTNDSFKAFDFAALDETLLIQVIAYSSLPDLACLLRSCSSVALVSDIIRWDCYVSQAFPDLADDVPFEMTVPAWQWLLQCGAASLPAGAEFGWGEHGQMEDDSDEEGEEDEEEEAHGNSQAWEDEEEEAQGNSSQLQGNRGGQASMQPGRPRVVLLSRKCQAIAANQNTEYPRCFPPSNITAVGSGRYVADRPPPHGQCRPDDPQWVQIELRNTAVIKAAAVHWHCGSRPNAVNFQVSLDGSSWKPWRPVISHRGSENPDVEVLPGNLESSCWTQHLNRTPRLARFVRMDMLPPYQNNNWLALTHFDVVGCEVPDSLQSWHAR